MNQKNKTFNTKFQTNKKANASPSKEMNKKAKNC